MKAIWLYGFKILFSPCNSKQKQMFTLFVLYFKIVNLFSVYFSKIFPFTMKDTHLLWCTSLSGFSQSSVSMQINKPYWKSIQRRNKGRNNSTSFILIYWIFKDKFSGTHSKGLSWDLHVEVMVHVLQDDDCEECDVPAWCLLTTQWWQHTFKMHMIAQDLLPLNYSWSQQY